jgi:transketolase
VKASSDAHINERYKELESHFGYWEKTGDIIDQLIDIILNYRQSGHPGGSRSKVHAALALLLSGVMRWDIRNPEKRFGDRFILGAGHTIPLFYCVLTLLNEALRMKYAQTGEDAYRFPHGDDRVLFWEDLLTFRRRGGLSGHAEMEGKTLFLKFNTGPSGHGSPAAAGAALALKRAGCGEVKVFCFEGEAGLTPGSTHETMNSAWGMALDNLYYLLDWNDYGIDDHKVSDAVYGTPTDWFASHGWRVVSTDSGSEWGPVTRTVLELALAPVLDGAPSAAWFKTRKGRGYLKYDNVSHGSPHKRNSELFWQTKQLFVEKYGAEFTNFGGSAPDDPEDLRDEFEANLRAVIDVLHKDQDLIDYLAERLVEIGESVPEEVPGFRLGKQGNPFEDPQLYDYENYPQDLFAEPGEKVPNRAALAKWGAWANAFGARKYDRPLFLISSADLAGSTNISGFAKGYGDFDGYGWYERYGTPEGVLLPQEITEFANSGVMAGLATVNLSDKPEEHFDGFWAASSTYGSFSYLMYGLIRLFSQLAQDCQLKLGKIVWVAGWEHNEVPVMLAAALKEEVPVIGLHLTRPPIEVPDREKLGMPSHFESARGAYVVRQYSGEAPRAGTIIVQGTSSMASLLRTEWTRQ